MDRQHGMETPVRRAAVDQVRARVARLLCLALLVVPAARAGAVGPPPEAAAVLDRFVAITGGKAAHDSIRNTVSWMTVTLPAQQITLALTRYSAQPGQVYVRMESPLVGKIESGVSGEVAWELSTMGGPRLKEGAEKAEALREAVFDPLASWRTAYEKAEVAGVDTVGGKLCDKLVLAGQTAKPRTMYFDRETGLVQRMDATAESPMGAVTVQALLGDYRKVGGLLMAHHTEVTAMGQKRVMTVDSVAVNVDLPPGRFDPPPEVKKLLEAKK